MKSDTQLITLAEEQGKRLLQCFVMQGKWMARLRFCSDTGDHTGAQLAKTKLKRAAKGIDYQFQRLEITLTVLSRGTQKSTALDLLNRWTTRAFRAGDRVYCKESTRLFNSIEMANLALMHCETPGLMEAA